MNSDIFSRYAELDPAKRPEAVPDWKLAAPVLLEAIDGRTKPMQVRETESPRTSAPKPRLQGVVVGAVTFAVILAVAVLGLALVRDTEDVASSELIEVAEGFARSVSAGATELDAYLSPGATYVRTATVLVTGDLAGYWAALDTDLLLQDCEQTGERLVSCEGLHSNAIHRAIDRELSVTWLFLFEDGRISSMLEDVDRESRLSDGSFPVEDYIAWLNVRHPEYLDAVEFVDPERRNQRFDTATAPELLPEAFLVFNESNAQILMGYLDEYQAEMEATGGIPENWSPDRWSGR